MTIYSFPYDQIPHPVFGTTAVPLIRVDLYAQPFRRWMSFRRALADTGADISVAPRIVGRTIIGDYRLGRSMEIEGIIGHQAVLTGYIHRVRARIGTTEFEMPIAIADFDDTEVIFGRYQALDRFTARFVSGAELSIETQ